MLQARPAVRDGPGFLGMALCALLPAAWPPSAWVSAEPAQGLTETESSRALDTGGRERRSPSPLALAFPEGSCRWAHPPEHDITSHRKECSAP